MIARAATALVCVAAALVAPSSARAAEAWMPEGARTPAAYVVATDAGVLMEHASNARRQPASLAKLAGALVVMQAVSRRPALPKEIVTIGARPAAAGGTRLGLRRGERVAVEALLQAMLVRSANDACLALAEHVSGDADRFVTAMNDVARSIDMRDTRFVDPCGFDRPGQYTTAADLLKLARAALADETITRIAEMPSVRVPIDAGARVVKATATNALLGRYDGAFGLKTGHTREAGSCLIAAARHGSHVAIVVMLGARDRWPVSVAMLDEAFGRITGVPRVRSRATFGEPD